ncbi:hypothetical protein FRB95_002807 [Tulasnella sp. JGI-2019a]|nr:hypothetical protein FRB95_002807 [Tulasnella sp. JGI-2019a]
MASTLANRNAIQDAITLSGEDRLSEIPHAHDAEDQRLATTEVTIPLPFVENVCVFWASLAAAYGHILMLRTLGKENHWAFTHLVHLFINTEATVARSH